MVKAIDDSCVLYTLNEQRECEDAHDSRKSEETPNKTPNQNATPNETQAKAHCNMKSPGTIDFLKKKLFVLKQNLKNQRPDQNSPENDLETGGYVQSHSIEDNIVIVQPSQLASQRVSSRNYSSPPCSRQQSIDSLKVIDLSKPEIWNLIIRKLQSLELGEGIDKERERMFAARENRFQEKEIISVDSNTVVYMNVGDSNCSSRGTKTPIQSKFPSRDENSSLTSSQNLQKLFVKLLELQEAESEENQGI